MARQGPALLAQAVVEFAVPLAAEESDDGEVPVHERGAVAPRGVDGGNPVQSAGGARGAGAGEAGRADCFGRGMALIRAEAGGAKMTRDNPFASKEALIVALREKRDGNWVRRRSRRWRRQGNCGPSGCSRYSMGWRRGSAARIATGVFSSGR